METAGIRAATWVVGKALSPLSGGLLEAWGASSMLGSNMEALKMQLLYAQAMLNNVRGREIHNPALGELLDRLRQLAYGADDLLDELDYFRIQDEIYGTYHAADAHAAGCVQDLFLNARHTARACVNKLKLPVLSRVAKHDDGNKQGCISGLRFCESREISSSQSSPTNQVVEEVHGRCMPKVASRAREASHAVGKHCPCYCFLSVHCDDPNTHILESSSMPNRCIFPCGACLSSEAPHRNHEAQPPRLKFDRVEISRKISVIAEQLKPICAMVSTILNLELLGSSNIPRQETAINRTQTTPEIIEPKLYGRDSQRNIVVDEIVNGGFCALTVLPIVGPGGIGKTTFIQHIYEEMKSHFQVPIWICVSLDFNANRLGKDIVKKIPEVDNENKKCSTEELIEQRIKGKRVLLVLDDVWTHHGDEWTKLLAVFRKEGAKGNMVIVTTRIPEVANRVKTTKCSVELERLSPKDIMSFFEECVFGDQKPWVEHPGLVEVGSKIVDKLKGSPLAAKTVGRLLRNKLTSNYWISILESKEWESQTNDNDIMPALKLSYDCLPFHLQQCFYFCALFPEDYEFSSEELVHLWIGLNILNSCDPKKKRIEDIGFFFLNELVNHGFFKIIKKDDGNPYYVIHDLLHELAVHVSSYECLSIYSSNVKHIQIPPTVRHLSIIVDNTDVKDRLSFEDYDKNLSALGKRLKVENLHTLMLFGHYHGSFAKTFGGLLSEAKAIRVIFLSGASYNVDYIFHNFAKLVHLRYLRIQPVYHWILSLPNVLFRLYHLEVIDLSNVYDSVISTRHMSNLVKMRHFVVQEDKYRLQSDIVGVGRLKFLQELREFRVGKESNGFELSQLGQLTELGGSLGIYNLEKVLTKEEANELKLIHKNHLREIIFEWDAKRPNRDIIQEENVLESLVPHRSLQELHIKGHGGTNCPTWLCENLLVKGLETLSLDGVSWKNLPPLGEIGMVNESGEDYQGCSMSLPSFYNLKKLELISISWLKKWAGNSALSLFSRLEALIVRDCPELTELPFSHPTCYQAQREENLRWFPELHVLVIVKCPKLASVLSIPWRMGAPCSAEISEVGSGFEELLYPKKYGSKLSLEIVGKEGQGDVLWNGLNFSNLTDLEELYVNKCPPLPLGRLQVLTSLKKIELSGSISVLPPVQIAGHGMYQFPVENLRIKHCDNSGKELTLLLSFLPNLSTLRIEWCENITTLGVAGHAETVSGEQRQRHTIRDEEILTGVAAAAEGLLLLPPQLQEFNILNCEKVSLLSNPLNAGAAGEGSGGGLQRLHSLHVLRVDNCPEFLSSYSSSSFSPFPACLQDLYLRDVKRLNTLQALSALTSLTELSLIRCEGSTEEGLWPLLANGRLELLSLYDNPDFFAGYNLSWPHDKEVFSRSCKILELDTDMGFLAAPICSLFSSTLTKFGLSVGNKVECFTEELEEALLLLTSLEKLQFCEANILQRLPAGVHKLTNLKTLEIVYCDAIKSLPSLPSFLQVLDIRDCAAIKSLPNSLPGSLKKMVIIFCTAIKSLPNSFPDSLEILRISRCKAIKSLPKDGLPRSMLELHVEHCGSEELKRECRKLIGTIPIIIA